MIQHQIIEMDRHKWIESEKAGCDLGQSAMLDWAENFMDDFFVQQENCIPQDKKASYSESRERQFK